jgi:membrane protein YqaA with SNARE-associated domain
VINSISFTSWSLALPMDIFNGLGLLGLGISAFLAATILPLSSELVLSSLLIAGEPPIALLIVATVSNVAGSTVNYALGRWGANTIFHRWFKLTPHQINAAEQRFNRYGKWSLLFSWLPVIGDPLTFIAGMFKVKFFLFLVLVTIGKFGRYWVITQAVLANV